MRSFGRMIMPACSALSGFSLPEPEEQSDGFGAEATNDFYLRPDFVLMRALKAMKSQLNESAE